MLFLLIWVIYFFFSDSYWCWKYIICGVTYTYSVIALTFIICSVKYSDKVWTAVLSWGNIRFAVFGLILSGNLPDNPKESTNEIQIPTNYIILPWPTYTELKPKRCIDLEPSPKRASNKINMLKQGKNKQKKLSKEETPKRN